LGDAEVGEEDIGEVEVGGDGALEVFFEVD
jgi:hypothetical protein